VRNSPISMPHPMHLHGFGFRVLRRRGTFGPARALATESSGRLPTDLGVKDTIVVWPNETVWLAVDFALPDDAAFRGRQRYMFHCHNLEHEDGMMMVNFAVL
jgi:FtsP/CotA-like multicopper oxidase with cupredoxin domain